ncbi:hypothetical protein BSS2_I1758 [Brucella suis bv. 1 str. S2]|uniref:Uncharacterized protein n=6 Tax=Brucella TaxID=234 RepID=A0A0H3GD96_BRUSU|nr:hypothetical protein BR1818 [Brucella suis 1330]ACU48784.1 hypothetical protein BMI_I1834 [Brucella microti CCM 4915]AEK55109.1 hypothetical protein BPI_I1874 [Brucella pinnipedialis B2/94]AEU06800.1 hypothetical protein BSVBI22_A1814 [Brucella suis VBI22]AHN47408.1 hypothetical protein BSS2_I1758 [Brucella suis bv. 1 str. S2]EEX81124.1 predicted protein [Brucella abortus bv. 9 str. C68]EEX88169.1 predicted protein [Brucella ceti B1/94]EEZ09349.1 predicted protein [Brucella ceti M490/95/1
MPPNRRKSIPIRRDARHGGGAPSLVRSIPAPVRRTLSEKARTRLRPETRKHFMNNCQLIPKASQTNDSYIAYIDDTKTEKGSARATLFILSRPGVIIAPDRT